MIIILIGSLVFGLLALVFQLYWKDIVNWCKNAIRVVADLIKGVVTFTKQARKTVPWLYRRWRNGKITKIEVPIGTDVDVEDLPNEVAKALDMSNEVLVSNDVERELE